MSHTPNRKTHHRFRLPRQQIPLTRVGSNTSKPDSSTHQQDTPIEKKAADIITQQHSVTPRVRQDIQYAWRHGITRRAQSPEKLSNREPGMIQLNTQLHSSKNTPPAPPSDRQKVFIKKQKAITNRFNQAACFVPKGSHPATRYNPTHPKHSKRSNQNPVPISTPYPSKTVTTRRLFHPKTSRSSNTPQSAFRINEQIVSQQDAPLSCNRHSAFIEHPEQTAQSLTLNHNHSDTTPVIRFNPHREAISRSLFATISNPSQPPPAKSPKQAKGRNRSRATG